MIRPYCYTAVTAAVLLSLVAEAQVLDTGFGTAGEVPYGGATSNSQQNSGQGLQAAVQPDGKVVVCMDMADPNTSDLFYYTYRFNPDGSPDAGFGNNGVSRLFVGDQSRNHDLQIEPDGRITVIGQSEYCTNGICGAPQFIMMRLLPDGGLDSTFGVNGHLITTDVFGSAGTFSLPYRVRRLPSGQYITGGRGINGRPYIARHQNNGFPDASFATAGIHTDMTSSSTFVDLEVDGLGNTYALLRVANFNGGVQDPNNLTDTYILKLSASGQPVASFGTNGMSVLNIVNDDRPSSITLAPNGDLVVTGEKWVAFVTPTGALITSANPSIPNEGDIFIDKVTTIGPDRYMVCGKVQQLVAGNFREKAFLGHLDMQGQWRPDFNGIGHMVLDRGSVGTSGWQGKLCRFFDVDVQPNGTAYATGYRNPIAGNTLKSLFLVKLTGLPMAGSVLGVADEPVAAVPLVYPVPTEGAVTVEVKEASELLLYDARGMLVAAQRVPAGRTVIDASVQAPGVYLLKVRTPAGRPVASVRVVKQ